MSEPETQELEEMRKYEKACREQMTEWMTEAAKPLRVNKHGQITQGAVWIHFTGGGPVKVKKPKHRCPECGASHIIRQ